MKNEFRIGNVIFTEEDIPILEIALRSLKKDAESTFSAPLREDVRLKLQEWITMLDTPEFNETDAEIVRNEMEHCISKNSEIIGNRVECKENTESVIHSPHIDEGERNLNVETTSSGDDIHNQIEKELNKNYASTMEGEK